MPAAGRGGGNAGGEQGGGGGRGGAQGAGRELEDAAHPLARGRHHGRRGGGGVALFAFGLEEFGVEAEGTQPFALEEGGLRL